MAWTTDLPIILRVMLDDVDETEFTDASIKKLLVVGAQFVITDAAFVNDYVVSVSDETITPDPTIEPYLDESFTNLVCLKAACLGERGAARKAANNAFSYKDMGFAVDGSSAAGAKLNFLLKGGYCQEYKNALFSYLTGSDKIAGKAIMTPFRVYASQYSSSPYCRRQEQF